MIKVDATKHSVLVYCTLCSWTQLVSSTAAAAGPGAAHHRNVHPEAVKDYYSIQKRLARHAADRAR